jgi:hypothetical protein
MTDTTHSMPPFPGFPGFPPAEMLDSMWGMMRLSPFGSALTGGQPGGGGLGPSLSMMSDMMAPLTNVEELDKRITDMRAVEQWLKLNLSMLQSAIQALEVQRATLTTLRAFGAFAQASMAQPAAASAAPSPAPTSGWPHPATPAPARESAAPSDAAAPADSAEEDAPATPPFDASAWWNLLQSQFNQIAQFAMTQPAAAAAASGAATDAAQDTTKASASGSATADAPPASQQDTRPATKRPAAKRTSTSAKRSGATSTSGTTAKKSL